MTHLKYFCDAPIKNGGLKHIYGSQHWIMTAKDIVFERTHHHGTVVVDFVSEGWGILN